MTLDQARCLHHARERTPYPDLDRAILVPADRDPLDHAALSLAQRWRVGETPTLLDPWGGHP